MRRLLKAALLAVALGAVPCDRAWAGPAAPADNPAITLYELPGDVRLTSRYDDRSTLTLYVHGRRKWSLQAKDTLVSNFDEGQTLRPLGDKMFALYSSSEIEVRDIATARKRFQVRLSDVATRDNVNLAAFALSPDQTRLAIGGDINEGRSWQGRLRLFDARTGKMLQENPFPGQVSDVKWLSPTRLSLQVSNPDAWEPGASTPKPGVSTILLQEIDAAPAPAYTPPAQARSTSRRRASKARKRSRSRSRR